MPKAKPTTQRQQRKRRVRISKAAPFPIPIESVSGESASDTNWIYYTAVLEHDCVVIRHTGDMDFLYRMGFFGKGSMSRGQPEWSEHWRVVTLPRQQFDRRGQQAMFRAKVTSRRRYMTHLRWHLLSTGDQPGLDKVQEDEQCIMEDASPNQENPDQYSVPHDAVETVAAQGTADAMDVEGSSGNLSGVNEEQEDGQVCPEWAEEDEGDEDFWGEKETALSAAKVSTDMSAASWDMTDPGDADFWGQDDASTVTSRQGDTPAVPSTATSVASSDTLHQCDLGRTGDLSSNVVKSDRFPGGEEHPETEAGSENAAKLTGSDEEVKIESDAQSATVPCSAFTQRTRTPASTTDPPEPDACNQTSPGRRAPDASNVQDKSSGVVPFTGESEVSLIDAEGTGNKVILSRQGVTSGDHVAEESTCAVEDSLDDVTGGGDGGEAVPGADGCDAEWSQFCAYSDDACSGSAQFVVPDSDDEELVGEGQVCRLRTKWDPVIKRDPFPIKENLHLGFEEAFFLSYGLGCLSVLDTKQAPMNLEHMWKEFCQRRRSFLPNYIAYHHYRSKNWVPKTGLKFGCTFLLYKDGPPFYHGSYSVVVRFVDTEGKPVQGFEDQRQFSWTSLAGLKRITEHVGKELMFCYVIKPKEMSAEDMLSPKCMADFRVKEVIVSRWVSSQEREDSTFD